MDLQRVLDIISGKDSRGFIVAFDRKKGKILHGDWLPMGSPSFRTESEAWEMAEKFAEKTRCECINIRVLRADFSNVSDRVIENR